MQVAMEVHTIGRLVRALRTLEERRNAGEAPPWNVLSFLSALDRVLTDDERRYIAIVFAACREQREELTAALVDRLGVARGAVIAGLRAHLEGTFADTVDGTAHSALGDYLDGLRSGVLAKVAAIA